MSCESPPYRQSSLAGLPSYPTMEVITRQGEIISWEATHQGEIDLNCSLEDWGKPHYLNCSECYTDQQGEIIADVNSLSIFFHCC